ncbi:MAG: tetratricopeptide repeat protein [Rhodobacteraceae bacterium]|nr:tetratricopeptide repeat protein [Paracoccaceae bacterium]
MTGRADPRLELAMKYYNSQLDDEAWRIVAEIVAEQNPPTAALQFAASLRYEARDLPGALTYCDRLLVREPRHAHALLIKGRTLFDLGRDAEADAALCEAIAANPDAAAAHFNRGLVLERLGQFDAAAECYRAAVARQNPYPVAWNSLGNVLDRLGFVDDAIAAFKTAVDQFPNFSPAHNNLGATLAGQGRFSAAAAAYENALACDPENLAARLNLGVTQIERGQLDAGRASFAAVLKVDPQHRDAADNLFFSMVYDSDSSAEIGAAHKRWAAAIKVPARPRPADATPHRPLRIGYVSADFRRHSVSFFFEPLLAAHDATQVQCICFSNGSFEDDVTARLRSHAIGWRSIQGLSAEQAAGLIAGERIDVLVDLSGHTMGNRLDVFALRPAPVQVTMLGYPATTGMAHFDARLVDAITDPEGSADAGATEPLIRLPAMHCYRPLDHAPPVAPMPDLDDRPVQFGSFNKLAKICEHTLALWAGALAAVSGSRLIIKAKALGEAETQAMIAARFQSHGIDPDRISMSGWHSSDQDHLSAYASIDVALDTFPYNGTTTTCEALWMGVPVITLCGHSHASRVGASLLASAGLPDFVATSDREFIDKASQIARDRSELAILRNTLRPKVAASRLCDAVQYARAVEAAYRDLWAKLAPG